MIQSYYHLEGFLFSSLNSFFSMSKVQKMLFDMSAAGAFLSIAFLFSAVNLQSVLLIFSWIRVIVKLTTVCSLFLQSLMLSGVCWRLLKNSVPYLLYWQGEVWGFLVARICKSFSLTAFDWSISSFEISTQSFVFPKYGTFLSLQCLLQFLFPM